jgi:hypothetical protein
MVFLDGFIIVVVAFFSQNLVMLFSKLVLLFLIESSWHAPKFFIRPTWGSKYVKLQKDGTWGPLPTSSTKGGKRGVLEVPGLD